MLPSHQSAWPPLSLYASLPPGRYSRPDPRQLQGRPASGQGPLMTPAARDQLSGLSPFSHLLSLCSSLTAFASGRVPHRDLMRFPFLLYSRDLWLNAPSSQVPTHNRAHLCISSGLFSWKKPLPSSSLSEFTIFCLMFSYSYASLFPSCDWAQALPSGDQLLLSLMGFPLELVNISYPVKRS